MRSLVAALFKSLCECPGLRLVWDVCGCCACAVSSVFTGKEFLLVCGSSIDGDGVVRASVLSVACLVAASHGWFLALLGLCCFHRLMLRYPPECIVYPEQQKSHYDVSVAKQ